MSVKYKFYKEQYGIKSYQLLRVVDKQGIETVGIKCLKCGMTSWNENDVKYLYCGNCHAFHEDQKVPVLTIGLSEKNV